MSPRQQPLDTGGLCELPGRPAPSPAHQTAPYCEAGEGGAVRGVARNIARTSANTTR